MRRVSSGRAALALALLTVLPLAACSDKGDDSDGASATTLGPREETHEFTGRVHLTGELGVMTAGAAAFDPIPTPFTITVPDAGRGGLDLPEAVVDGTTKSIVWNGGRPLPVTGECKLDAGEAALTLGNGGGARIALDGAVRELTAGSCTFGSSVAVGAKGLSSPVDSVRFTLPNNSDFTTSGGASVGFPAPGRYEGRKGPLELRGSLRLVTEDNRLTIDSLSLTSGTWVVTVTSSGSPAVLHVVADLEGKMVL